MSTTAKIQMMQGTVTKRGSIQTITVTTKVAKVHPIYKKRYSQLRHYLVHDEAGTAQVGDSVTIAACRPISKSKSWKVIASATN
jgi:small subunit ribosomal protein S17